MALVMSGGEEPAGSAGRRGAGEGRADTGDEPGADEVAPRKTHTALPAHESLSSDSDSRYSTAANATVTLPCWYAPGAPAVVSAPTENR